MVKQLKKSGGRLTGVVKNLKVRLGEEGYLMFPVVVMRFRRHNTHFVGFPKSSDLPFLSIYPKGIGLHEKVFIHHFGKTLKFKQLMEKLKADPIFKSKLKYTPLNITLDSEGGVLLERYLNNDQKKELFALMR